MQRLIELAAPSASTCWAPRRSPQPCSLRSPFEGVDPKVTLGADGSLAPGGSGKVARAALPVTRGVDTTGAGDSFAAGFLTEYCASRDLARSLERARVEAARTIQHIGAFEFQATV